MGMMINRRRVMGGKSLPYDAEIEWLKSDRNCLVDTGITLFDTDDFELHLCFMPTVFYDYVSLFAASTDSYEGWMYSDKRIAVRINDKRIDTGSTVTDGSIYDLQIIGKNNINLTYILNDEIRKINRVFKSEVVGPLCLFGGYRNRGGEWIFYSLKLKKDNAIVRDYIPVRVGQIGYMYDKISGQLFGNNGTGSFILGPDKN